MAGKQNQPGCIVNMCPSIPSDQGEARGKVIFFSFPNEPSTKEKWTQILSLVGVDEKSCIICSLHFLESSFEVNTLGSFVLKSNAVPSVNLDLGLSGNSIVSHVIGSKNGLFSVGTSIKSEYATISENFSNIEFTSEFLNDLKSANKGSNIKGATVPSDLSDSLLNNVIVIAKNFQLSAIQHFKSTTEDCQDVEQSLYLYVQEAKNRTYEQIKTNSFGRCRLCFYCFKNSNLFLFSTKLASDKDVTIKDCMTSLFPTFSDNLQPNHKICHTCYEHLLIALHFSKMALSAEEILNTVLKNQPFIFLDPINDNRTNQSYEEHEKIRALYQQQTDVLNNILGKQPSTSCSADGVVSSLTSDAELLDDLSISADTKPFFICESLGLHKNIRDSDNVDEITEPGNVQNEESSAESSRANSYLNILTYSKASRVPKDFLEYEENDANSPWNNGDIKTEPGISMPDIKTIDLKSCVDASIIPSSDNVKENPEEPSEIKSILSTEIGSDLNLRTPAQYVVITPAISDPLQLTNCFDNLKVVHLDSGVSSKKRMIFLGTSYCIDCKRSRVSCNCLWLSKKGGICEKCGIFVRRSIFLEKHVSECDGSLKLICEKCNTVFKNKFHYNRHLKNIEDAPVCNYCQCKVCLVKFTKDDFKEHVKVHPNFLCPNCGKSFIFKVRFSSHIARCNRQPPAQVVCYLCGKLVNNLDIHVKQVHVRNDKEKTEMCDMCDKRYRTKRELRKHKELVHCAAIYGCSLCDKKFKSNTNLKYHFRIVHVRKPVVTCEICKAGFARRDYYRLHMKAHHSVRSGPYRRRRRQHRQGNANYICIFCKKEFASVPKLRDHYKYYHVQLRTKCELCHLTISGCNMQRHIKLHEDPYFQFSCRTCFAKHKSEKELQKHMQKSHSKKSKNIYQCYHCNEPFRRKYMLMHHIADVHTPQYPDGLDAKLDELVG